MAFYRRLLLLLLPLPLLLLLLFLLLLITNMIEKQLDIAVGLVYGDVMTQTICKFKLIIIVAMCYGINLSLLSLKVYEDEQQTA